MKDAVDPAIIAEIWSVIQERAKNPLQESYTSRLLADDKGIDKVLEKVGEESTEFIIAAKNGVNDRTVKEASDLIFHLLVALHASDIDLSDVLQELERRRK
jgi:phosphoribosyl-ATP pyrophosphohydrolase